MRFIGAAFLDYLQMTFFNKYQSQCVNLQLYVHLIAKGRNLWSHLCSLYWSSGEYGTFQVLIKKINASTVDISAVSIYSVV